jgi:hypothetical protein
LVAAGFSLRLHRLESLCYQLTAKWYQTIGFGLDLSLPLQIALPQMTMAARKIIDLDGLAGMWSKAR